MLTPWRTICLCLLTLAVVRVNGNGVRTSRGRGQGQDDYLSDEEAAAYLTLHPDVEYQYVPMDLMTNTHVFRSERARPHNDIGQRGRGDGQAMGGGRTTAARYYGPRMGGEKRQEQRNQLRSSFKSRN